MTVLVSNTRIRWQRLTINAVDISWRYFDKQGDLVASGARSVQSVQGGLASLLDSYAPAVVAERLDVQVTNLTFGGPATIEVVAPNGRIVGSVRFSNRSGVNNIQLKSVKLGQISPVKVALVVAGVTAGLVIAKKIVSRR